MLGPLLVAVIVNVTFVPNSGLALLTDLVTAMSADCPVTGTEAESLPGTRSGWLPAVLVAVLVTVVVLVEVAVMVRVWLAPLASGPICQIPVPGTYVPRLATCET